MPSRRRRKTTNTEFAIWVVVLAVLLISTRIVTLNQSQIELALGGVLVGALIIVGGLVWWQLARQAKVRAGLRALNFDQVDTMTGVEFEHYVGAMLPKRGFTGIAYTPSTGDDGVDITARRDRVKYAIQTKRFTGKVGKTHVFPITSARDNLGFHEAMLVTNSYFTRGAKAYAAKARCELVDRDELARWREEQDFPT